MENQAVIDIVTAALERRREQTGGDWQDLAKDLKVDADTIWRWRKGKLGKATRILVELVAASPPCNPPSNG